MVELRKRKEAPPAPVRPAKKPALTKGKRAQSDKTVVAKVQETIAKTAGAVIDTVLGATNNEEDEQEDAEPPKAGETIKLENFGGDIETNDGKQTTLSKLVEESKGGVVLFTYPKASTPGCKHFPCQYLLSDCIQSPIVLC